MYATQITLDITELATLNLALTLRIADCEHKALTYCNAEYWLTEAALARQAQAKLCFGKHAWIAA